MAESSFKMSKALDLIGQRFGRLTALYPTEKRKNRKVVWHCSCDCGSTLDVVSTSLSSNHTNSCGCYLKERITVHNMWGTPTYTSWDRMIQRCTNSKDMNYHHYGGRSISVCGRWLESFENFHEDMGERPSETSLDRVDVNKGYSVENCRWASHTTQARNTRTPITNTSGTKGVSYNKSYNKWEVYIGVDKKRIRLGYFDDLASAIACRREGELKYWNTYKEGERL